MALIIRIDVDRPYGRRPLYRHLLSRLSSDVYLPRLDAFGYLSELQWMLGVLNERRARAYVFFRQCTLPSTGVMQLMEAGGHVFGLHLEDSRSFETFMLEKETLERHIGRTVFAVSKHGSGGAKFGRRHHAPYEPEKYLEWAGRSGMKLLLGNLEDPALSPERHNGVTVFPSAFWLEPYWRDTRKYTPDWLRMRAAAQPVVLLVHPENVQATAELTETFAQLAALETTNTL